MVELQPIVVFNGCHFVRHLGICNRICVKLLQLMLVVIGRNSVRKKKENEVSISNRFSEVHKYYIHIETYRHRLRSIRRNAFRLKILAIKNKQTGNHFTSEEICISK